MKRTACSASSCSSSAMRASSTRVSWRRSSRTAPRTNPVSPSRKGVSHVRGSRSASIAAAPPAPMNATSVAPVTTTAAITPSRRPWRAATAATTNSPGCGVTPSIPASRGNTVTLRIASTTIPAATSTR